jgi:hypothetical protein
MARCTAPVQGHRTASGRDACPACGGRSSYYSRSYTSPSYARPSNGPVRASNGGSGGVRPRWSPGGSGVRYTEKEVRALTPARAVVEARATIPALRDVFLCHAWDDRAGAAKDLHDRLEAKGVAVWFSEKDVLLGVPLLRAIDKGLAASRIGIVLVTPSFLARLRSEGIVEKELSALLRGEQLIPVMHGITFEELEEVSPMLASRSGLSTAEQPLASVADKIAELVDVTAPVGSRDW